MGTLLSKFGSFTKSPDSPGSATSRTFSASSDTLSRSFSTNSMPTSPVLVDANVDTELRDAFNAFLDAGDISDIIDGFEDVLLLIGATNQAGGSGLLDELSQKLAGDLNFKQKHYFRTIMKRQQDMRAMPVFRTLAKVKAVVVGSGPVGLRGAIELALMGADVTIIEMRNAFPRLNILHLWDWACDDLADLGFTRAQLFGPGGNNHISTRTMQTNLTRLALILGVRIHTGVKFAGVDKPATKGAMYQIRTEITDTAAHNAYCTTLLAANILIDAGGTAAPVVKHYKLTQKHQKLSQALGLVAHFKREKSENASEEFSHAYQYKQKEFERLKTRGIDIENVVHYKRGTHYLVMTPTVGSLTARRCLKSHSVDKADMLKAGNINMDNLRQFARDVAVFWGLPETVQFIDDKRQAAQIFDFSERTTTVESMRVEQDGEAQLLVFVVGDALIEPFWPEGLGINRGFFSVLDTAFIIQTYFHEGSVAKEFVREMLKVGALLTLV